MAGLHENGDSLRLEDFLDCKSDLSCKTFLDLQSTREYFYYSGYLRKAEDPPVRDITDMDLYQIERLEVRRQVSLLANGGVMTYFSHERY